MSYVCSKDPSHQSTDNDYCSICGAKIEGAASALPPAASAATTDGAQSGEACPDCGIPRHPGARFCEVCRYNYETHTSGGVAAIVQAAPPEAPAAGAIVESLSSSQQPPAAAPNIATAAPAPTYVAPASWEAVVRVDATLYTDPDPAVIFPQNDPERVFPLDLAESLIGRRSDRQDIHPEIPLADPGVSHRHAKIFREADGNLSITDVGSTNSTIINGIESQAGVRVPLKDGDEITIGCWTRIVIRRAGS